MKTIIEISEFTLRRFEKALGYRVNPDSVVASITNPGWFRLAVGKKTARAMECHYPAVDWDTRLNQFINWEQEKLKARAG